MMTAVKAQTLKAILGAACAATLALGAFGCGKNRRDNRYIGQGGNLQGVYGQSLLAQRGRNTLGQQTDRRRDGRRQTDQDYGTRRRGSQEKKFQKEQDASWEDEYRKQVQEKLKKAQIDQQEADKAAGLDQVDDAIEELKEQQGSLRKTRNIEKWQELCKNLKLPDKRSTKPDRDRDDIPDLCEDDPRVQEVFPALGSDKPNFYAVSLLELNRKDLEAEIRKEGQMRDVDYSWLEKIWLDISGQKQLTALNQRIAETIFAYAQEKSSDVQIIETMYNAATTNDRKFYMNQGMRRGSTKSHVVLARGGASEPIVYNPRLASTFRVRDLTGVGSNINTMTKGQEFLYITEAYVKPSTDVRIRKRQMMSGRPVGGLMVFVDGSLELLSIDLSGVAKEQAKKIAEIVSKQEGIIKATSDDCGSHLVVALIGAHTDDPDTMIRENIVANMGYEGEETKFELLPQEIAMLHQPDGCEILAGDKAMLLSAAPTAPSKIESPNDDDGDQGQDSVTPTDSLGPSGGNQDVLNKINNMFVELKQIEDPTKFEAKLDEISKKLDKNTEGLQGLGKLENLKEQLAEANQAFAANLKKAEEERKIAETAALEAKRKKEAETAKKRKADALKKKKEKVLSERENAIKALFDHTNGLSKEGKTSLRIVLDINFYVPPSNYGKIFDHDDWVKIHDKLGYNSNAMFKRVLEGVLLVSPLSDPDRAVFQKVRDSIP